MNFKRLHPDHQEGPESLRGLFLLTAIVSAVMILLFSGFSFYRVFSGFVIASARDDSVNVCHLLIDQQRQFLIKDVPGQGARLAVDPDTISSLDRVMREFLHPFGIIKIKVYDNSSRILYSTDATIIGRIDSDNRRLLNALAGHVDAKMKTKDEVRDLDNEQLLDVDVVETYVPVRDEAGKVLGSSEIYLNVSKYRNLIRIGVTVMIVVMVLVLTAVFGISYILVRRGTVKLRQVQSKLETMATTDLLTGIANRGQIMIRGEQEFARAVRNRGKEQPPTELCCIMLDIDHFKLINDNWGHQAGDQVLREVALRLRQCVRPYDIVGRYGGEEFMVLLPDTTFDQGLAVAERIRTGIHRESIRIGADEVSVSVSLGVSRTHENDRDLGELIKKADQGLYKAKEGGRDRVEWIHSPLVAEGAPYQALSG